MNQNFYKTAFFVLLTTIVAGGTVYFAQKDREADKPDDKTTRETEKIQEEKNTTTKIQTEQIPENEKIYQNKEHDIKFSYSNEFKELPLTQEDLAERKIVSIGTETDHLRPMFWIKIKKGNLTEVKKTEIEKNKQIKTAPPCKITDIDIELGDYTNNYKGIEIFCDGNVVWKEWFIQRDDEIVSIFNYLNSYQEENNFNVVKNTLELN